jgi:hypothetical protein
VVENCVVDALPVFYPVYRWRDYYSHSLFELIKVKGKLNLNQACAAMVERNDFLFQPLGCLIDVEIEQVLGSFQRCTPTIRHADDYVAAIANALVNDCAGVEAEHDRFTNVILCGGRDSLNALLLPWHNNTIAVSGQPNYPLVREFCRVNRLDIDVLELADDVELYDREVAFNACRMDLRHNRWVHDLVSLSERFNKNVIFWLGQHGDVFQTGKWRSYGQQFGDTVWTRFARHYFHWNAPFRHKVRMASYQVSGDERLFFDVLMSRGAMWQGVHTGLLREITDALVLSLYHGPRMVDVLSRTSLKECVACDLRPLVGEAIFGKKVFYPNSNPSPPPKAVCIDNLSAFIRQLGDAGIAVQ